MADRVHASPVSGAPLAFSAEVAEALSMRRPVVALESTIIAHGFPRPANLEVAHRVEEIVRAVGAVPATIAVLGGVPTVGLDDAQLKFVANTDSVVKASRRDLPLVMAAGEDAATTVAATSTLAALAGIKVFATGGLGGVHRGDLWDESADLSTLSVTDVVVVCAGVKSILDVRATLERLESYGIAVVGFGTTAFPGFYLADSGFALDRRVDTADEVAAIVRAARGLSAVTPALIVANPVPESEQLDVALHDRVLQAALTEAEEREITGSDVTPFLLERLHRDTQGESLRVNTLLIERNARLAAEIAVAISG